MNEESYPFAQSACEFRYKFVSVSEKKKIQKVVLLAQTDNPAMYNLALMDLLENGGLSDTVESKNEDLKTVLATIFKIVDDFLNKNPDCFVGFRGSDDRRHRLYRIVIARELPKINEKFVVYGGFQRKMLLFEANEVYDFYFIKKRYEN